MNTLKPSILLAAAILVGCGDEGSYELTWTIGCSDKGGACELVSSRQCSSLGVDMILVTVQENETIFPCYSSIDANTGRGPGLLAGPTTLSVSGLAAGGLPITGPVDVGVEIPAEGFVAADVDLPTPPQCHDGMDNDNDGLVDLLDIGCSSVDDPSELE